MHATTSQAARPPLTDLRREIDAVDDAILELIARRTALAARAGSAKSGVNPYRPAREDEVLARMDDGTLPAPLVRAVWRELISAALAAQGLREVVVASSALAPPARAHFGAMLAVRVDPQAARHADRADALAVIEAGADRCGRTVLAALCDATGARVGDVLGAAR